MRICQAGTVLNPTSPTSPEEAAKVLPAQTVASHQAGPSGGPGGQSQKQPSLRELLRELWPAILIGLAVGFGLGVLHLLHTFRQFWDLEGFFRNKWSATFLATVMGFTAIPDLLIFYLLYESPTLHRWLSLSGFVPHTALVYVHYAIIPPVLGNLSPGLGRLVHLIAPPPKAGVPDGSPKNVILTFVSDHLTDLRIAEVDKWSRKYSWDCIEKAAHQLLLDCPKAGNLSQQEVDRVSKEVREFASGYKETDIEKKYDALHDLVVLGSVRLLGSCLERIHCQQP